MAFDGYRLGSYHIADLRPCCCFHCRCRLRPRFRCCCEVGIVWGCEVVTVTPVGPRLLSETTALPVLRLLRLRLVLPCGTRSLSRHARDMTTNRARVVALVFFLVIFLEVFGVLAGPVLNKRRGSTFGIQLPCLEERASQPCSSGPPQQHVRHCGGGGRRGAVFRRTVSPLDRPSLHHQRFRLPSRRGSLHHPSLSRPMLPWSLARPDAHPPPTWRICVLLLFEQTDYAKRAPAVVDGFVPDEGSFGGKRFIPPFFSVDHFFPSIGGGVPLFHHYQHLPHVAAATVARTAEQLTGRQLPYSLETDGLALVVLCAMPAIVYHSLRAMKFSRLASAVAAVLYVAAEHALAAPAVLVLGVTLLLTSRQVSTRQRPCSASRPWLGKLRDWMDELPAQSWTWTVVTAVRGGGVLSERRHIRSHYVGRRRPCQSQRSPSVAAPARSNAPRRRHALQPVLRLHGDGQRGRIRGGTLARVEWPWLNIPTLQGESGRFLRSRRLLRGHFDIGSRADFVLCDSFHGTFLGNLLAVCDQTHLADLILNLVLLCLCWCPTSSWTATSSTMKKDVDGSLTPWVRCAVVCSSFMPRFRSLFALLSCVVETTEVISCLQVTSVCTCLGPDFALSNLIQGNLLDYQAMDGEIVDRGLLAVPVVTTFALAGAAVTAMWAIMSSARRSVTTPAAEPVAERQRSERDVWILCCFAVWTVLFCGRGTIVHFAAFARHVWVQRACIHKLGLNVH
mgnify:CR=1 FL=1